MNHLEALWHFAHTLNGFAERTNEELALIYDRRAEVWAQLVVLGVEQKEIADHAGVDPSDVSRALSTRGL